MACLRLSRLLLVVYFYACRSPVTRVPASTRRVVACDIRKHPFALFLLVTSRRSPADRCLTHLSPSVTLLDPLHARSRLTKLVNLPHLLINQPATDPS